MSVDKGSVSALGFSYSIDVGDKRAIVFQTHLAQDCTGAELDMVLDKVRLAMERQANVYMLPQLRKSLLMQTKNLKRATEDLAFQDEINLASFKTSGKRGDFKLSAEQEAHRRNVATTQGRFKEEIDGIKREIAELEAAIDAPNRSPNS